MLWESCTWYPGSVRRWKAQCRLTPAWGDRRAQGGVSTLLLAQMSGFFSCWGIT